MLDNTPAARLIRAALLLGLSVLISTGCAYNYAGEDAPDRHYSEEKSDDARVVKVKQADESTVKTSREQKAKSPDSPCGVETFEVHRYDPEKHMTRTVDCRTKEVVKVERKPLGQTQLDTLRDRGHPEDAWYLLVDPEGLRSNYVNNVELMKMRKHFELAFEGKDRREELMIYTVEESLDTDPRDQ
jgi:hypothetical protein